MRIDEARESGEVIYSWEHLSNTETLYRLPDGSGLEVHCEWGGAVTDPWVQEWSVDISKSSVDDEIRRRQERWDFEMGLLS